MIIFVASGKGGKGKTTTTAAFATLSDSHVLTDCDVDAADLQCESMKVIKLQSTFSLKFK